jgi:hypothetical protein
MSNTRSMVAVLVLVAVSIIGAWTWFHWSADDNDPGRAKLREAVIETGAAFRHSPCDVALERKYLDAAAAYARAFAVLGGCPDFPACRPGSEATMRTAKKIFASRADARVRDAMRDVHEMGIRLTDYPGGLGLAVDYLSEGGARREGQFVCTRLPNARDRFRDAALQALRLPGPGLCTATERRKILTATNLYYTQRDNALHGVTARNRAEQVEVVQAWSTPADLQIDGLVREFYTAGYLRPGDLATSPTVEGVLAGIKPGHNACAAAGRN